jgi:pimeloyl-ACP methyl ester carboxylesterase
MKNWQKILIFLILFLFLLLAVGPFLIPVPPLADTVPAAQLADPDSQFVALNGLLVHYKEMGAGQPTFILLHGFGASLFSWREVMEPLSQYGRVVAFDRPAFGLTERPMPGEWTGQNPYSPEAQVDLVIGLLDALVLEQAILVGNSAGGTVALNTALTYPDRVQALVLVDAAVYTGGGSPRWARPILKTPQVRHLGPLIARQIQNGGRAFIQSAWHDPSQITPQIYEGYEKPLQVENWDRALWELTAASRWLALAERLDELSMPVLVITGDDDRIVPTGQSLQLAEEIPGAALAVIPDCGHLPHEECPASFMDALVNFLAEFYP